MVLIMTKGSSSLSNGLAMFSMFFGAGNITFPLAIGLAVQGQLFFALLGLIITAILMPLSGFIGITLFDGDYHSFFHRMGKLPGTAVILILLLLIGPFGGIPRCITLTYSTLGIPGLPLWIFSILAGTVLFISCWKRSRIVPLIGNFLSPVLLLFLLAIIVKGVFFTASNPVYTSSVDHPFWYGLKEGYNTMDLLATFFFSSLICARIKNQGGKAGLLASILKASAIGGGLLALVYVGFSYTAASYSDTLSGVPIDRLLGRLGHAVLGPYAGLFVCVSIALTCLTTALALTAICAEYLQEKVFKMKMDYHWCLAFVLVAALLTCTLEFSGIVALLGPVLQVLYPALVSLSIFNILHKLYNFKSVKMPVYATIAVFLVIMINKMI
ncbi:MAG: Branched-chain amino acid transport system 2 carrier protein [Chlamydiia bacterium]|nr:Branched-chain amino acid transport system 2 carrier protein [Chlamydiia bacterium]MCH9615548.1 Branched-chain amino acid transport system 2 carrier protein [Chlamydiia bacterium]MCH9629203.1 Branched-chain amino acid transport system 2 carrier protein [Chlamydiia bacterium]